MFWIDCKCPCHEEITQLFKMTGKDRTPQQNPLWSPPKSTFKMPTMDERVIATTPRNGPEATMVPMAQPTLKRDPMGILPPTVARSYAPTVTGRSARGELEDWVREQTNAWAVEFYMQQDFNEICTPAFIAKEIGQEHGINPPSTGAITAVLDRWERLGFAMIGRKPIRFIGYTKEGLEQGLEAMKLRAKTKPSQAKTIERVTAKRRA